MRGPTGMKENKISTHSMAEEKNTHFVSNTLSV